MAWHGIANRAPLIAWNATLGHLDLRCCALLFACHEGCIEVATWAIGRHQTVVMIPICRISVHKSAYCVDLPANMITCGEFQKSFTAFHASVGNSPEAAALSPALPQELFLRVTLT